MPRSIFIPLFLVSAVIADTPTDPPDEEECLHDADYLRDVYILIICYAALLVLCCTTFAVRTWVARQHCLPLFGTHVVFLVLILLAISLRTVDLFMLPCLFTIEDGATVMNLLANCPIMLMFTIFTMLLYHTFIVLHSIQLSCDPIAHDSGSALPSPLAGSPMPGSPLMASRVSENNERAQGREVRDFSWPVGPEALITRPTEHPRRRCTPSCPFWVMLCGRPHSSMKLLMIGLNVVVWLVFIALLVADSADMLVLEFRHGKPSGHLLSVYLLELPSIMTAVIISMCFLVSGTKLINKLRNLHRILLTERFQGSSRTNSGCQYSIRETVDGLSSYSSGMDHHLAGSETALGPTLRPSHQAQSLAQSHDAALLKLVADSAHETVARCSSLPNISPAHSPRTSSVLHGDLLYNRTQSESCRYRSRVAFSTMTMSVTWIYDEPSVGIPCVLPVISGVRRILIVVCVCVMAFLLRASMLTFFAFSSSENFPRHLWLPYLALTEVTPYALLLLFYLIPGCQAIFAGTGRADSILGSQT